MPQCLSPFVKKETNQAFPCGRCYECKIKRLNGWVFRLQREAEVSASAFFVTLTLAPEHIVMTENGFMTLKKSHLQNYFKRLRKLEPNDKIKYYAVGEYGGKFDRPHYHIILFGSNIDNIEKAWTLNNKMIGSIHIGNVSIASIAYSLKYISKESEVGKFKRDDRLKEFSLMSKGMGISYVTPQIINWHRDDLKNRMYLPLLDGYRCAMPRYYKKHFYTEKEREEISVHIENQFIKEYQQQTPEERYQKELISLARGRKTTQQKLK